MRAFVNRWPSFPDDRCEVVLYTPDHDATFWSLGVDGAARVVDLWADGRRRSGARDDIAYVLVFENRAPRSARRSPTRTARSTRTTRCRPRPAAELSARGRRRVRAVRRSARRPARHRVGGWRAWVPQASVYPVRARRRAGRTRTRPAVAVARAGATWRRCSSTCCAGSTGCGPSRCRTCCGSTSDRSTVATGPQRARARRDRGPAAGAGRAAVRRRRRARQRAVRQPGRPRDGGRRAARTCGPMTDQTCSVSSRPRDGSTSSAVTPTTPAGSVLPMAIDLGTTIVGERGHERVVLVSHDEPEPAEVPLDVDDPTTVEPTWARYVAGVVAELRPDDRVHRAGRHDDPDRHRAVVERRARGRGRAGARGRRPRRPRASSRWPASGPSTARRACRAGSWTSSPRCCGVEGHALLIDCTHARRHAGAVARRRRRRRRRQRASAARCRRSATRSAAPRSSAAAELIGPLPQAHRSTTSRRSTIRSSASGPATSSPRTQRVRDFVDALRTATSRRRARS